MQALQHRQLGDGQLSRCEFKALWHQRALLQRNHKRLNVTLNLIDLTQAFAVALQYTLSAFYGIYQWLVAELKTPLVTFDDKPIAAAQIHSASLP